jgi:hypothetical protein
MNCPVRSTFHSLIVGPQSTHKQLLMNEQLMISI